MMQATDSSSDVDAPLSYFSTTDDSWFTPTSHARGPWDPRACHAGPPTGLIVRAMERAIDKVGSGHRVLRITADLGRPVPMAGFRIEVDIGRSGRMVTALTAHLTDENGRTCVTATGLAMRADLDVAFPTASSTMADFADSEPGEFPMLADGKKPSGFAGSVSMRYPTSGESESWGTTVWMKSAQLLGTEETSPFQRICPLADCGNAFSRNADPGEMSFVNADLTINLHRQPEGEWMGSRSVSHWQPSGVGMSHAVLFDQRGAVGVALQTLLLVPFD